MTKNIYKDEFQKAYKEQQYNCTARTDALGKPIEMRLTEEEWKAIWVASGKWDERGVGKDRYVMSRYNDIGHYELGNVYIEEFALNASRSSEQRRGRKMGPQSEQARLNSGAGVRRAYQEHPERFIATCPHCGKTGHIAGIKRHHFENCGKNLNIKCPHCDKTGNVGGMKHWHFDNCLLKPGTTRTSADRKTNRPPPNKNIPMREESKAKMRETKRLRRLEKSRAK